MLLRSSQEEELESAIVVGIQVDIDAKRRYQATPDYPILDILEGIFIFVYTAELLLRYFVYRLAAFQNAWVHSADYSGGGVRAILGYRDTGEMHFLGSTMHFFGKKKLF